MLLEEAADDIDDGLFGDMAFPRPCTSNVPSVSPLVHLTADRADPSAVSVDSRPLFERIEEAFFLRLC